MKTGRGSIFFITVGVTLVSMALFFAALANGWFGVVDIHSGASVFCEAYRPGLIKQPANTWSNLGFVFAGLLMAWQLSNGRFDRNKNNLTTGIFYGSFFSCLAVLLGPGSMAMHASGTNSGGFFDMLSMYLVASFTVSYSAQRYFSWKPVHFTFMFLLVLVTCLWANFQHYHIVFNFFGNAAFAFFITLTVVIEALNTYVRQMHHRAAWGFGALAAILAALGIWNLSKTGDCLCDPQSLLQGHAAWHLLDALSVYCLFRFYVSEHREEAAE
ncbi:MAG TPA: ceramidase domain-containing protein [Chitinophagales bacterium]|nr:ceramidase domain-containing protein [Chitinophagales bacterium]